MHLVAAEPDPVVPYPPPPRLLNRVRDKLRMKHYSTRPVRRNRRSLRARGCVALKLKSSWPPVFLEDEPANAFTV